jgi:hypothetical protein
MTEPRRHPNRHPDFEHPFGIADWNGVRAKVRKGPDGLWYVMLVRGDRVLLFPGLPHLSQPYAMAQADRVMRAAGRVLRGEI